MDVYILDNLLRRIDVMDTYESMIWTERYSAIGDFQMTITSTPKTRSSLYSGVNLAINNSHRMMTIETVEDSEGTLKVSGRSIELLLEERIARPTLAFGSGTAWAMDGLPQYIVNEVVYQVCVTGQLSSEDVIPFLTMTNSGLFPADTIPPPTTPIMWVQDPTTVYAAIKEVLDAHGLGFRIVRKYDESTLHFEVYSGVDRTTAQTTYTPVVLGASYDSLDNIKQFSSIQDSKNVAYVIHETGMDIVFPEGVSSVSGFNRRVLLVTADAEFNTTALRTQLGRDELALRKPFSGFDGEINQRGNYRYGISYNLGDYIELRDEDEVSSVRRVTEQIIVCDGEGERSYPTLTAPDA